MISFTYGNLLVHHVAANYFILFMLSTIPLLEKEGRRRKWQPTPVFLPGECHGQRSLVGPSP